jgi:hypothetical protein
LDELCGIAWSLVLQYRANRVVVESDLKGRGRDNDVG